MLSQMWGGQQGNKIRLATAMALSVVFMGTDDCSGPKYRYTVRLYKNKFYRTYSPNTENRYEKRMQTFEDRGDGYVRDIGGDRQLGNDIEARGVEIYSRFTNDIPGPNAKLRAAQRETENLLYLLDVNRDRALEINPDQIAQRAEVALNQLGAVALRVAPDGSRVYVLIRRQSAIGTIPARAAALVVMQTRPLRLERRIDLANLQPKLSERGLEISSDGRELYFVDEEGTPSGAIVRMDAGSGAVINRIPTPRTGFAFDTLLLSPDGKALYARASTFVYGIDTQSQTVSFEVLSGGGVSMAVHPNGQTLYVSRSSPVGVQIVDAVQGRLGALVGFPEARSVTQMQMEPDGRALLFNDDSGGGIYTLRLLDNTGFRVQTGTGGSLIALVK